MMPNICEVARRDMVKTQSGQRVRQMTGERKPFWIYHDEPSPPPIHTGFGMHRIIVGRDEEHVHSSPKPFPRLSRNRSRSFDLLASRQERHAILESPSKILRVRQLKSIGRNALGQSEQVRDLTDVVAMNHDVQSQLESERYDPLHDLELPVEGRDAGNPV